MKFEELTHDDLIEALITTNGDCILIENPKDANKWMEWGKDYELSAVLPEDKDFSDICTKLELTPGNNPKRVFKITECHYEVGYLALAPDWDMA